MFIVKSSASFITGNFSLKSESPGSDISAETEQLLLVPAVAMISPRGFIIIDSPQYLIPAPSVPVLFDPAT